MLVAEVRPIGERSVDDVWLRVAKLRVFAVGLGEQLALDAQHLASRVDRDPVALAERHDLRRGERLVGPALELADRRAVAGGLGMGAQDGAAVERTCLAGEGLDVERRDTECLRRVITERRDRRLVESVLGCASAPLLAQPVDRHAVVLGPARLERGNGGRLRRTATNLGHPLDDLAAPAREVADCQPRNAEDLGRTARNRTPADTELARQLVAKRRLVEEPSGAHGAVERPSVERAPPALGADEVGDKRVGVQLRVAGPGRAVTECRDGDAIAVDPSRPAAAAAGQPCLAVDEVECLQHRRVVRRPGRVGHLGVADTEQDRDGLRRREREVKRGDRPVTDLAQTRAIPGPHAAQQLRELVSLDGPGEAELRGARAEPAPGCLAAAGVVVLEPVGDRVDVVALRAAARPTELCDRQHALHVARAAVIPPATARRAYVWPGCDA